MRYIDPVVKGGIDDGEGWTVYRLVGDSESSPQWKRSFGRDYGVRPLSPYKDVG